MSQKQNAVRERGGITLHDYTQGIRPASLRDRFNINRKEGILQKVNYDKAALGLLVASMGLGLMELLMPKRVQNMVGVRGKHTGLIQMLGAREIGHALLIGIYGSRLTGVWSRVIGDAVDLAYLGSAFNLRRVKKDKLTAATVSILGITALDVLTATQLRRQRSVKKGYSVLSKTELGGRMRNGAFHVLRTITIDRTPQELYQFWRNFENLPQFMFHLEDVQVFDDRRSHWVAKAPAGKHVEWDAEIIEDRPNELISWQSTSKADVPNSGVVRFEQAPAGRGTVVHVEIEYRPPAGSIGRVVAMLFGEEPGQQVAGDLHRFKQVMETGEVLLSEGSPKGYGQKAQRPAQPMSFGVSEKISYKESERARADEAVRTWKGS